MSLAQFSWRTFMELVLHIFIFKPLWYLCHFWQKWVHVRQRVKNVSVNVNFEANVNVNARVDAGSNAKTNAKLETRRILWQKVSRNDYPDPMRTRLHSHAGYEDARTFVWHDPYVHVQNITKDGVVFVRTKQGMRVFAYLFFNGIRLIMVSVLFL